MADRALLQHHLSLAASQPARTRDHVAQHVLIVMRDLAAAGGLAGEGDDALGEMPGLDARGVADLLPQGLELAGHVLQLQDLRLRHGPSIVGGSAPSPSLSSAMTGASSSPGRPKFSKRPPSTYSSSRPGRPARSPCSWATPCSSTATPSWSATTGESGSASGKSAPIATAAPKAGTATSASPWS